MPSVQTGLECFIDHPPPWISGLQLGLLCNPASIDARFCHARQLIHRRFPGRLKILFSPQHGFYSEKQDNMVESGDIEDPDLGIPVISLYGKTRIPEKEMLDPIDVLIVDLQDVGTRVYTFIYTLSYCLEAAKRFGKKILVLDRPNPVGGSVVEGNCLDPTLASFVGRYPMPMRHGLTIGELSRLFNDHWGIGCDLTVVPMRGWNRNMFFKDTGLPWVPPSPNLPTVDAAMVYPGQVIWEGTNVSEGRGTAQPFEVFGAPFFRPKKIVDALAGDVLPGVVLRETGFEPIANKWQGRLCRGFQIHILNPEQYRPYRTTLTLLRAVYATHSSQFEWKSPPYEYEYENLPIDLISGDRRIRRGIEGLDRIEDLESSWRDDLVAFAAMSGAYHLY